MMLNDPSEAVESSRILPLLNSIFYMEEVREYGGTILHLLFNGIAHNFLKEDDETERILRFCFDAEDMLLKMKEIESDFVIAICKKKVG